MQYGDLSTFFGGLEAKIGAPNPKVREAMEAEHTEALDSKDEFTASNYGIKTTPQKEWWFVTAEPGKEGIEWPTEAKLQGTAKSRSKMRKPMPLGELQAKLDKFNAQLEAMGGSKLMIEEAFGARLYTGPMCAARQTHTQQSHTQHTPHQHTQHTPPQHTHPSTPPPTHPHTPPQHTQHTQHTHP